MDTTDNIIPFPGTPSPVSLQEQITELMWAQQAMAEELIAINRTLLQLVRVLKENS